MIRVPEPRSEGMSDEQDMAEWTFSIIVQSDAKGHERNTETNQEEKRFHALIYVLLGATGLEKLKAHAKNQRETTRNQPARFYCASSLRALVSLSSPVWTSSPVMVRGGTSRTTSGPATRISTP